MILTNFIKVKEDKYRVMRVVYKDDDYRNMGEEYITVDNIIDPLDNGKEAQLYINPVTKETWYEYIDIPLPEPSKEEQLEQRIASLEKSNAELTTLIATMTTPQM